MAANSESNSSRKERERSERERKAKERGRALPHYTRELGRELTRGEGEAEAAPSKKPKE